MFDEYITTYGMLWCVMQIRMHALGSLQKKNLFKERHINTFEEIASSRTIVILLKLTYFKAILECFAH